jgi:hypothetical protein
VNNDQNQPGILDKIMNLGSRVGATGMTIWGTPEQKARGREILDEATRARTSPHGTPPLSSAPAYPSPGLSGLSGVGTTNTPVSTPAAPGTPIPTAGSGLSGFSGIGATPGTPGVTAGAGGTTLLPAGVPGATFPGGMKPPLP